MCTSLPLRIIPFTSVILFCRSWHCFPFLSFLWHGVHSAQWQWSKSCLERYLSQKMWRRHDNSVNVCWKCNSTFIPVTAHEIYLPAEMPQSKKWTEQPRSLVYCSLGKCIFLFCSCLVFLFFHIHTSEAGIIGWMRWGVADHTRVQILIMHSTFCIPSAPSLSEGRYYACSDRQIVPLSS